MSSNRSADLRVGRTGVATFLLHLPYARSRFWLDMFVLLAPRSSSPPARPKSLVRAGTRAATGVALNAVASAFALAPVLLGWFPGRHSGSEWDRAADVLL